MQENEFEKRVRQELDEFSLVPNQQVWQNVQKQIRQEKRRRLFFYWFLASALLAGITKIVFLIQNSNNSQLKIVPVAEKLAKEGQPAKFITKKQEVKSKPEKQLLKGFGKARSELATYSKTVTSHVDTNRENSYPPVGNPRQQPVRRQPKREVLTVEENLMAVLQPKKGPKKREALSNSRRTRMEGRPNLPPHKYFLGEKAKQDTSQQAALFSNQSNARDTAAISANDNKTKQPNLKHSSGKWRLGFTIYGGLSGNVRGIAAPSEKSFATANLGTASSSPPSTNFALPTASQLQYNTSASFGFGVFMERALTKRLSLSVGLDYHFVSAKSVVGNKIDSALTVFDSVLQKTTTATAFYRAGLTTTFSNKYHLLQMPVNLQIQINNSLRHPLLFSFGLSPSLIISSNALYLNNKLNGYYQEKEQFNHLLLFGQSDLLYALRDGERFQLSIGPTLHYDFNSFSKAALNHPQHLIFTGFKASITFK